VIKYGIIRDAAFFRRLERQMTGLLKREPSLLTGVVVRCCEIKADVVGQDETESGVRAILNFGHTIGHALEAVSRYGRFLHGEAIAIGQVLAARLSCETVGLPAGEVSRMVRLFEAAGLPVEVRVNRPMQRALRAAMWHDKKVSGGIVKFVLVPRMGEARFGVTLSLDQVERVIAEGERVSSWRP
jgi:3-dehydroquinate synthase